MQSKGENKLKDEVSMDSEYLRILSETLESGVSILDENMNYLYLSDSVYSGIGATRDQLKPGDPLSKCHDIMFANGFFSSEILNQQELSAEEQKQRNANGGDDEGFRLVTMEISKSIYAFLGPDIGEKVKKQSFLTMVHPEDRHLVKAAMTSAYKTGNRFDVTARTISVDGAECYMATSGEIIRDADGKITRIQAFVRNVTDARLQAEELENAKDYFGNGRNVEWVKY